MQPVLVLAPHLTSLPVITAEAPPPEGAFLAMFETERPEGEASPVPLVLLGMPLAAVPLNTAASAGEGEMAPVIGQDDPADLQLAALAGGAAAMVAMIATPSSAEGLETPIDGRELAAPRTESPTESIAGSLPQPAMAKAGREAALPGADSAEGGALRTEVVLPSGAPSSDAKAVQQASELVPDATVDPAVDRGQTWTKAANVAGAAGFASPEMAAKVIGQAGTVAALPITMTTGVETLPKGDGQTEPTRLEALISPPQHADTARTVAAVLPPSAENPAVGEGDPGAVVTSADDRISGDSQPDDAIARPRDAAPAGFWERLFSTLAMPTSAGDQVAKAAGPGPSVGQGLHQIADVTVGGEGASPAARIEIPVSAIISPQLTTITPPVVPASITTGTGSPATPAVPSASSETATELMTWLAADIEHGDGLADTSQEFLPVAAVIPSTSGISAASGPSTLPSTPVPQVASQIAAALSHAADGATELALSPDELGHVRLRLEPDAANPDRMVVMITFERPETLDLFRRHAGELSEALRAAGYAGADIGFGQDGGGAGGFDRPGDRSAERWATGQDGPDLEIASSPAPRLAAGASLDLRL